MFECVNGDKSESPIVFILNVVKCQENHRKPETF